MKIVIGSDHGGYKLKNSLIIYLSKKQHAIFDVGAFSDESCDYPDFAKRAARILLQKKSKRGILICKSGLGMSMAANRIKGIRAALCHNVKMVKSSRQHNDANVLVFGANYTKELAAKRMCDIFIKEAFSGGRHARRVKKIEQK